MTNSSRARNSGEANGDSNEGSSDDRPRGALSRLAGWIARPGTGIFLLGATLAFGVLGASDTLGRALRTMNQDNVISVKGVAEIDVTSDTAAWWGKVRARAATLPEAYVELEKSMSALRTFVLSKGIDIDTITVGSVDMNQQFKRDEKGNQTNEVEGYVLSQSLGFASSNVRVVRTISNEATALIKDGVEVESGSPVFKVTSIEKTKLELLEKATANAFERAQVLARGSGSGVGALVSASQGVYQIISRGSTSSSDYGEYDTSAIDKTARVVVTLEYAVR